MTTTYDSIDALLDELIAAFLDIEDCKPVVKPKNSRVEQLVARKAHNLEVVGSNPTPATTHTDEEEPRRKKKRRKLRVVR